MSQPWRDVMQADDWRKLWATHSNQPRTNSYDLVRSLFFQTITKLGSYHIIPKDKLEFFPNREEHLRKLSSFVKYKLQPRSVDEPNLYKIAGELLERCLLKKQYLKGVREYYQHEGKVLRDPKNLIDLIRAPKINLGRLLPPVQGVRLEVHAPPGINLQFEYFQAGQQASTALAVAFGQWANAFVPKNVSNPNPVPYTIRPSEEWKSISKKPFFVWLETQHICTGKGPIITGSGQAGQGASVSPDLLGCVKKIIELEERRNHTLQVKDGFLKKLDTEENYDTTGMAGKGGKGIPPSELTIKIRAARALALGGGGTVQPEKNELKTAAFVWTHKEELLVGEHKAAENVQYTDFFHHTSLDAGNPVLCAGMIRVINGKVELISNDSGHYQPGEESLKRFVRWLQGQYCLTENAIVSKISDNILIHKSYPTVGEFLGEATPAATPGDVLKKRNNFLDSLRFEVGTVSSLYDLSQGKAVAFIRIRSPESKIASQYFGGDFKNDIDTAIKHRSNNLAWKIPIRIVMSLAGISKEPLALITENVKTLNQQDGIQFSTTIYDLKPLKRGSTMSGLLEQKIRNLNPPDIY